MLGPVLQAVVAELTQAGVNATDDPARFHPDPIAALVSIPDLELRTLGGAQLRVPVWVVCSDPLTPERRDQLWGAAWAAAQALAVPSFELRGWNGGGNPSELPAYLLEATVELGGSTHG